MERDLGLFEKNLRRSFWNLITFGLIFLESSGPDLPEEMKVDVVMPPPAAAHVTIKKGITLKAGMHAFGWGTLIGSVRELRRFFFHLCFGDSGVCVYAVASLRSANEKGVSAHAKKARE